MHLLHKLLAITIVGITLLIMFYTLTIFSLFSLVPWDTALIRPELGTWQRRLNDFFEVGIGNSLLYIIVLLMVFIPIMKALSKRWDNYRQILLLNSLYIVSIYFMMMIIYPLKHLFFPYSREYGDPFFHNYGQQIIPFFTLWISYGLWLNQIRKLPNRLSKRKNKAKNTLAKSSINRLTDTDPNDDFSLYEDNHVQSEHFASQ